MSGLYRVMRMFETSICMSDMSAEICVEVACVILYWASKLSLQTAQRKRLNTIHEGYMKSSSSRSLCGDVKHRSVKARIPNVNPWCVRAHDNQLVSIFILISVRVRERNVSEKGMLRNGWLYMNGSQVRNS